MARRHKKTPCTGCENRQPPFLPGAIPIWNLWCRVSTQWRVGMDIVGLDYLAVFRVAELYCMAMTPDILEGIQVLERDFLRERADGKPEKS